MNKERNYKLDNTKALLIFLVVLGHMADYYVSISDDMKFLFFFIYIFHMPLFIFLSGLFIKSTIDGARLKIEKVFSYLIMFFLLKISLFLIDKYLFLKDINFNTFNEGNVPWYMFAMAAWICLTYLLKNIKPLYLLSFSILLGLIIGYDSYAIDYLVISRIIVYFPFFLLGYYFTSIDLMKIINRKSVQYFSIVFLLSLISFIFINIQEIYQFRGFLTGRNSYEVMNQSVFGGFYRSFFYILAAILALAIMSIMPNKKFGFTVIGERTLQIFFLHMICISLLHYFNVEETLKSVSNGHWLKLYILLSVPLTLMLALKPLEWPFKKIMSFKYTKIFK